MLTRSLTDGGFDFFTSNLSTSIYSHPHLPRPRIETSHTDPLKIEDYRVFWLLLNQYTDVRSETQSYFRYLGKKYVQNHQYNE